MLEKNGLVKLVEECGELIQIASKKMARMDSDEHWDSAGSIRERMEDEMGDVMAAMRTVTANFGLDTARIMKRRREKEKLFLEWLLETNDAELTRSI